MPHPTIIKIIWAALVLSCIQYYFIAQFSWQAADWQSVALAFGDYEKALAFLSGGLLVLSYIIPAILFSAIKRRARQATSSALTASPSPFVALVIRWALIEASVIMGLVLCATLGKNIISPFVVGSLIAFALSFPKNHHFNPVV